MVEAQDVGRQPTTGDVLALRAALETARAEADTALQRANAERKDEIDQLQATITRLREEMIHQREELVAELQAVERDAAAEAAQLREAVVAARQQADALDRRHDAAAAEQAQRFETERRELESTITELRRRLENATHGDPR